MIVPVAKRARHVGHALKKENRGETGDHLVDAQERREDGKQDGRNGGHE